jgi:hypothetical protein
MRRARFFSVVRLIRGAGHWHPAMAVSLNVAGSLVLEIGRTRLEALFLDYRGDQRDSFVIVKEP